MTQAANQSNLPTEVYFLGAGASVSAGLPTFADFRKKSFEICKNVPSEDIKNQFENVFECWVKKFNEYNLEEFYAAIEIYEILGKSISVKTEHIEELIFHTIKQSKNTINSNNFYEKFLIGIQDRSSCIITTNWDIELESSRQYLLENGLIEYENVQAYDTSSNKREPNYYISKPYKILKLHGSLNWGFCNGCEKIYYFNEIYDSQRMCNDEECKKNNLVLNKIIIPPKLSKLIKPEQKKEYNLQNSVYFQLVRVWEKAYEYLKSCEEIYFIGYSFPQTDVQMMTLISNALRENSNLNKVVIVSSPKLGQSRVDFEERYLSIFPRNTKFNVVPRYIGFEEFSEELFSNSSSNTIVIH